MGINYYVRFNECECCGHFEEYHIGKSSAGWCFSLHVDPDEGINNLEDMKWLMDRGRIFDEYGAEWTKEEMLDKITNRSWNKPEHPYGYRSWENFYHYNNAEAGPCGLNRHRVGGCHCVGHGEGTWDYIIGEFS
ncbi:MAG: hypothetical protein ACOC4Y_01380 [bacterium]